MDLRLFSEQIVVDFEPSVRLRANEDKYPIIGDLVSKEVMDNVQKRLVGCQKYAQCLEKSTITRALLPFPTRVIFGSLRVFDVDWKAAYGFDYHPPFEFHAWLVTLDGRGVIDVGLPGVILRGRKMVDDRGPLLVDRYPIIIAGVPPDWAQYDPRAIYHQGRLIEFTF